MVFFFTQFCLVVNVSALLCKFKVHRICKAVLVLVDSSADEKCDADEIYGAMVWCSVKSVVRTRIL